MRTAILSCLFAVFGYIATAQFTLLSQLGMEDFRTTVKYNEQSSFSPLCLKPGFQAGLRLDYNFKKMHGPWIAAATTRSVVEYSFSDPENGMNTYNVEKANTQLRLEGGYQLRSKQIYFRKTAGPVDAARSYKGHCLRVTERNSCGSKTSQAKKEKAAKGTKGAWMRLAPSAGIAYIPSAPGAAIEAKTAGGQTTYTYNAGNWRTAFLGGIGFEFGRNNRQAFLVSLNYLKGFGDGLDTKYITTVDGNKTTNTSLQSNASAWNLRIGIPISLSKKKTVAKEQVVEKVYLKEEKKCGQYKLQYKPRCYKSYSNQ